MARLAAPHTKIARKDPLNFSPAMNMLYQKFFLFDISHFAVIIKATDIFGKGDKKCRTLKQK
jgi:hypothetical protein